jgi:hypothetical protein
MASWLEVAGSLEEPAAWREDSEVSEKEVGAIMTRA